MCAQMSNQFESKKVDFAEFQAVLYLAARHGWVRPPNFAIDAYLGDYLTEADTIALRCALQRGLKEELEPALASDNLSVAERRGAYSILYVADSVIQLCRYGKLRVQDV